MTAAAKEQKTTWTDLINESVHTSDDIDIGDINAVSRNFVVVKRGFVDIHYYYIPIHSVEGWDGNILWLTIPEEKVVTKYEIDDMPPEPSRYFLKDYPVYRTTYYPPLAMIHSKYVDATHSGASPGGFITAGTVPPYNLPTSYKCDLCGESNKTDDELSDHVRANH
jgi:hypothetical protein